MFLFQRRAKTALLSYSSLLSTTTRLRSQSPTIHQRPAIQATITTKSYSSFLSRILSFGNEPINSIKMAKLIDGKAIADQIRKEIKEDVDKLKEQTGKVPGLAVVLVGDRKDSATYVRMKKRAAAEVGITTIDANFPADISHETLLEEVRKLNNNPDVNGILVQLPLPKHINEEAILAAVDLEKDVDGFNPINIGRMSMKDRPPLFIPCTPRGCIELLDRMGIVIEGKNAVVIGRSNIVGLPAAMLLLQRNATVTICHSKTKDIANVVRGADIIIAAAGRAEMVRGDWVKPGAVVIDVGTNPVDDPYKPSGYRLVGDVKFDEVKEVASAITPVPGGVGPMTIAMLLKATLESAQRKYLPANNNNTNASQQQ